VERKRGEEDASHTFTDLTVSTHVAERFSDLQPSGNTIQQLYVVKGDEAGNKSRMKVITLCVM
jgi:predicted transcriptional regulator